MNHFWVETCDCWLQTAGDSLLQVSYRENGKGVHQSDRLQQVTHCLLQVTVSTGLTVFYVFNNIYILRHFNHHTILKSFKYLFLEYTRGWARNKDIKIEDKELNDAVSEQTAYARKKIK